MMLSRANGFARIAVVVLIGAICVALLAGGLVIVSAASDVDVPLIQRSSDGENEPDESEAPERSSGTSRSEDASRANDEADEREPSEDGADEAEGGNEP